MSRVPLKRNKSREWAKNIITSRCRRLNYLRKSLTGRPFAKYAGKTSSPAAARTNERLDSTMAVLAFGKIFCWPDN